MIVFSKDVSRSVNTKTITQEELKNYLLEGYSAVEIADSLAELILKNTTTQQIAVTQEEYEKICSLFRVKGTRQVEGNYVKETRGRRPARNKEE